ncbi:SKP1/BTB/POZ domain superfamily protein [Abortiporus biennis]
MSARSPSPDPDDVESFRSIDPVRIPSFLDDPNADVILRSSDGVEFRVFKVILSKSSPFFNDMFSLPQATEQSLTAAQVIDVAEDSTTLAKLLTYCYPLRTPKFTTLEEVIAFISATDKYQLPGAMERVKSELETYSSTQPVQLYMLACRYSLERLAAKACLIPHTR